MKKILVVDDSALMRRVLCDIIEQDKRFRVEDRAVNGLEALELLRKKQYDVVVLDINMPVMTGLELLENLQKEKINARVITVSTDTYEGSRTTLDALALGALDFIQKPGSVKDCKLDSFKNKFLEILDVVSESKMSVIGISSSSTGARTSIARKTLDRKPVINGETRNKTDETARAEFRKLASNFSSTGKSNKIVAIASSTGGPKALQDVVPKLPKNLCAPVVIVQHMPPNFTKSLSDRLNQLSEVNVKEAEEGDVLENGWVYIARGGSHLNVVMKDGQARIHYTDEPPREGVKPCANYMYESLSEVRCDQVICVVMTGMGADATQGITNLKKTKKLQVIAQEESTCAVYGMPKSIVNAGLADRIIPLKDIAQEIVLNVGVR